jgi:transposase
MRIDRIFKMHKGKRYTVVLLRHAYRDNGKVRHKTLLNLSNYPAEEIEAMVLALKNKGKLELLSNTDELHITTLKSIGAVYLLYQVASSLSITKALGNSDFSKIVLWEALSRLIEPTSKLGSVRLAMQHAVLEVLNVGAFNEDSVYQSLTWLNAHQGEIEKRLFEKRKNKIIGLFLYDVTSSYFEGTENELAEYGYNRDKKKGKKQIVVGLLTDEEGIPVSVQVYKGNTQDVATLEDQIKKTCNLFGVSNIVFVGDKGMIKSKGQKSISQSGFNYITGLTKPQIEKLLKTGVFQMGLFDSDVKEIIVQGGIRYILRRNPVRADEMEACRKDKLKNLLVFTKGQNYYLENHSKAKGQTSLGKVTAKAMKLDISHWLTISLEERTINIKVKEGELKEISKLDGCYVLKSDVSETQMDAKELHDRYKDLSKVEHAFRDSKTQYLEVRPIFLRKEENTRAHVFIVMLSYMINQQLEKYWKGLDITVKEGIDKLSKLCIQQVQVKEKNNYIIPEPDQEAKQLLELAQVKIPKTIRPVEYNVYTKIKLQQNRKQ